MSRYTGVGIAIEVSEALVAHGTPGEGPEAAQEIDMQQQARPRLLLDHGWEPATPTRSQPMCLNTTVEGHDSFRATLAIAKDGTKPIRERQDACLAAKAWGIISAPHPRDVEPQPFCQLIKEGRMEAHRLWDEELSYQAQRALRRRGTEVRTAGN